MGPKALGSSSSNAIPISGELNSGEIPPALSYDSTIDLWDSETAYHQFLETNQALYLELDGCSEELTLQEHHIISFNLDLPSSSSS
jgi:hypothetical protein